MQAPLNMERENWKRLQSFIALFSASHLYTHLTLKENLKPLQKSYYLCSCCRDMTGWNTVLIEEWDFSTVRFVCALDCMLCGFMEGCTISPNIVQQAAAQCILTNSIWQGINSMLGLPLGPNAKTFCDEVPNQSISEHTYKRADEVQKTPCGMS